MERAARSLLGCVAALGLLAWTTPDEGAAAGAGPTPAEAAFERYKGLAGRWVGESTEGWEDAVEFSVIARDSVVMAVSEFEAHPNETMVTMYSLHQGRLILTHYCVAGNQPRLVASELAEDGSEVTFTWLDGTGLDSRDEGHMDRVVVRFAEDGSYSSRWTWYQDGESSWMEEIRLERAE